MASTSTSINNFNVGYSQVIQFASGSLDSPWISNCTNKWARAKVELQAKMTNWKAEWRTAATEWINAITIRASDHWASSPLTIYFPNGKAYVSSVEKFKIFFSGAAMLTEFGDGNSSSRYLQELPVDRFDKYWRSAFKHQEHNVPINLLGEIVLHIAAAFDGKIDYHSPPGQSTTLFRNYFHVHKQHLFPNWLVTDEKVEMMQTQMTQTNGWIYFDGVKIENRQLVQTLSYLQELIDKLCAHQITRLIDCHFSNRDKSENLDNCAHRFANTL